MNKRAQWLQIMILGIAILMVLYGYFLPASEKCRLVPSLPECKVPETTKILGFVPGILQEQETAARYVMPMVSLFRRETVDIATVLESTETSKSWFTASPKQAVFESQKNEREAKLFVFVNKAKGKLKIYVNKEKAGVIEGEGLHTVPINVNMLNSENNIIKIIPTTPIIPFVSNIYEIGKIVFKESYIITNNRVSLPFSIVENPKDILDIKLIFETNCFTDENLTVFIADKKIVEDKICKGVDKDVTDIIVLNNMTGNLTFASEGNYVIDKAILNVRMQERTWPTYYFYAYNVSKPITLRLGFEGTGMKKLTAYINGKALSVETSKKEWNTEINRYLQEGTNSVLLIPEKTINVTKLEVE